MTSKKVLLVAGMFIAVVVVWILIAICGGKVSESDSTAPAPGLINPSIYQREFVDGEVEHFLLDVRSVAEFSEGHLRDAVNIPVEILNQQLGDVPADRPIVVYCRTGGRSAEAITILHNAGFTDLYDLDGGIVAWMEQGLPVEGP